MMFVNKYTDLPILQDRMISLALEELVHFQQVVELMRARQLPLKADGVDRYVQQLLTKARNPKDQHLLDRLMITAVIEARSAERFCLFAEALPGGDLKTFYQKFACEEARHFPYFVETARLLFNESDVSNALGVMLDLDAQLIKELPLTPTVH